MSRMPKLLLYCALLGLAPGCSHSYPSTASPEMAMDGAAAPGAPPPVVNMDVSGGMAYPESSVSSESDDSVSYKKDAAIPMSPTSVTAAPARQPAPVSSGGEGKIAEPRPKSPETREGQGTSDSEDKKQYARQIVYTAEMQISVYKLDDAMQRAEELTLAAGGYVQNLAQGYYVLRIPAPALRGVMDDLARLGVVEARTLQARDVTEEYVDLSTRIRVLRETQAQLLSLLKQARNVDETLKVRESLDQITMQLEQALGRLRMLESLIGFSTLTVRMSQRGPQNTIPSSNDPFPWVDGLGVEATEWN